MAQKTLDGYLKHYGVLGMKWGKHRRRSALEANRKQTESDLKNLTDQQFMNKHSVSKKRVQSRLDKSSTSKEKKKKPKASDMSDSELRSRLNRMQMEKQYKKLSAEQYNSGTSLVKGAIKTLNTAVTVADQAMRVKKIIDKMNTEKT